MAHIVRREMKDYGGEAIWVEEDIYCPIYAAPHVKVTDAWLEAVLAVRRAGEAEQAVDALYAEWSGKASRQVDAKMMAEKERLGPVDYAKKTAAQVEADVKSIADPWADISATGGM